MDDWDYFDGFEGGSKGAEWDDATSTEEMLDKFFEGLYGENFEKLDGTYILDPAAPKATDIYAQMLKKCIQGTDVDIDVDYAAPFGCIMVSIKGKDLVVVDTEVFAALCEDTTTTMYARNDGQICIMTGIDGAFGKVVDNV